AGVKPQVLPGLDRLLRHSLVPRHEAPRELRPDHDLSGLTSRNRVVLAVDDPQIEELFQDDTGAAGLQGIAGSRIGDDVDLRHPVAWDGRHAEALLERFPPFGGDRHRHHGAQPVASIVVTRGLAENELGHHPETVRQRRARASNVREPARRAEASYDEYA